MTRTSADALAVPLDELDKIVETLETMSELLAHIVEQLERYEPLLHEAERRLSTPTFKWRGTPR